MKRYENVLKKVTLFQNIKEEDIVIMLDCLQATTKTYEKGSMILHAGDPIGFLGILLSGSAQIFKEDSQGNRNILTDIVSGDTFAEAYACVGIEESPVSVIASTKCCVLFLEFKRIITTCTSACSFHHKLIENMMQLIAEKNIKLNSKVEILTKRTTREKVLVYLETQRLKKQSNQFTIPFSRNELADFLCVDRSAMSRELGRMRDEGILSFEKNHFKLFL